MLPITVNRDKNIVFLIGGNTETQSATRHRTLDLPDASAPQHRRELIKSPPFRRKIRRR